MGCGTSSVNQRIAPDSVVPTPELRPAQASLADGADTPAKTLLEVAPTSPKAATSPDSVSTAEPQAITDIKIGETPLEKNIALLRASAIGDVNIVEAALKAGADVNAIYDPETMEHLANDEQIVESQFRQASITNPGYVFSIAEWVSLPLDATALILASRAGHAAVVKRLLLEENIDGNKGTREAYITIRNGQTALHWACRQGNVEVVRALLASPKVEINVNMINGFCPFSLAVQQGHTDVVEELVSHPNLKYESHPRDEMLEHVKTMGMDINKFLACDCAAGLAVQLAGGGENRLEVVRRCMKEPMIRKWFFDKENGCASIMPTAFQGLLPAITMEHSPAMLSLWLEEGLSPNACFDDGTTCLDLAVRMGQVENMRILLKYDAASTLLTPIHRAQVLGDAKLVKKLLLEKQSDLEKDHVTDPKTICETLPELHQLVLQGDDEAVLAKISDLLKKESTDDVCNLLDEGKLPAVFYAVEVGHMKVARLLFKEAYGFPDDLIDNLLDQSTGDDTMGQPSFRICFKLIESKTVEDDALRPKAMAFMKPWCSSLVATNVLEHSEQFKAFSDLCRNTNNTFYSGVDELLTTPILKKAAKIAADAPTGPIRQDDYLPVFKFYRHAATRAPFSCDHEGAVAHSYALLGRGLSSVFQSDVKRLFKEAKCQVVTVAPKSFQRMQNKLLNPFEHGDPAIPRPRCAKNVDVLRGCIIVETVEEMEQAYNILAKAYKVVRVKNTHDPTSDGYAGGYRSLLVNFLYEPGATWSQVFGDKVSFDFSEMNRFALKQGTPIPGEESHLGKLWQDYVETNASLLQLVALQSLQIGAKENPNRKMQMIAELQIVLRSYFEGRAVSHMLFKIARCDTGSMEMVRDFFQEYYQKEASVDAHLAAIQDIALAVKEGRSQSKPVTVPVPTDAPTSAAATAAATLGDVSSIRAMA